MNKPAINAREVEIFFQVATELRQAVRNCQKRAAHLAREELHGMMLCTDNATLRDRCARVLGC